MANFIRYIASFSDESITVAINSALGVTAKEPFVGNLLDVADLLETPAKKKKDTETSKFDSYKKFPRKSAAAD